MARIREYMAGRRSAALGDPGFGSWIKRALKPPKALRKLQPGKLLAGAVRAVAPIASLIPGVGSVIAAAGALLPAPSVPATAEGTYGPAAAEPKAIELPEFPADRAPIMIPGPGGFMPGLPTPIFEVPRDAGLSVSPAPSGLVGEVYGQSDLALLLALLQSRPRRRRTKKRRR